MRKSIKYGLCIGTLAALLTVPAFAADTPQNGIFINNTEQGATLTPTKADGTTVNSTTVQGSEKPVYVGAEKVTVTYPATKGEHYLALVLNDGTSIPTANNIVFIDQAVASGNTVSFHIFPTSLVAGKTYDIYIANSTTAGGLAKAGSFGYYASFKWGDVNNDQSVNGKDATKILQASVHSITLTDAEKMAADVNGDGSANGKDATLILQYSVHSINKFPVEQ